MASRYYERICKECGDIARVTYKPKGDELCRKCSSSKLGFAMSQNNRKTVYVSYTYFCPTCPSVRIFNAKRKTPYCADCNRVESAKKRVGKPRNSPNRNAEMRTPKPQYFRICPDCPEDNNSVVVASAKNAGIKPCRLHKVVPTGSDRKRVESYSNRKKMQPSKNVLAIERAKKINEEHKANLKDKPKIIVQRKTDEEMMEEFLKNNKPSVIDTATEVPHYCGYMNI